MGSACSTPFLDSVEPPLEILILSDGSHDDQSIVQFLHTHKYLTQSAILSKRLPPKNQSINHYEAQKMMISTSSNSQVSQIRYHARSSSISQSSNQSTNQSTNQSQSESQPMIFFLCDGKPAILRFHVCTDYQSITKRRASTLIRQTKPHTSINQSKSINQSIKQSANLFSNGHIDGCLVFLSLIDRSIASTMLIGGIRPLLKRKQSPTQSINPPINHCYQSINQSIAQVMPFVLIAADEIKPPSPVHRSINHSTNHPINQSTNQSVNQSSHPGHHRSKSDQSFKSINPPAKISPSTVVPIKIDQSINQSAKTQSSNQSINQSKSHPRRSSADSNQLSKMSINQSVKTAPVSQSTNQSLRPARIAINQSINQSVNQSPISKPLTESDGQSLAADTGASGFFMIDWLTGKRVDQAIRALVRAINAEKQITKVK